MNINGLLVSKHAINRMRERFRLYFPSLKIEEDNLTRSLILGQLSKSIQCIKWKSIPFYTNMIGWKYGNIEVYRNGPVFYVVLNNRIVTTVLPKWFGEDI